MPSGYSPRVLAVLLSLLPLVAAACAGTTTAPPPPAAPPAQPTAVATSPPPPTPVALESVRTGLNGSISEGAFYIAVDEGYFQQQGITLELPR